MTECSIYFFNKVGTYRVRCARMFIHSAYNYTVCRIEKREERDLNHVCAEILLYAGEKERERERKNVFSAVIADDLCVFHYGREDG